MQIFMKIILIITTTMVWINKGSHLDKGSTKSATIMTAIMTQVK